ncbi:MAG TPA: DinB family protein [Longimicrobiaceae bacterium]|nr:DinB family protein [Longimicrobiaceae bacterium]
MNTIVNQLLAVLREGFEGPPQQWSYFTDSGPEAGMFGTIAGLSAAEASQPFGPHGTTIAAHVHHMCFALEVSSAWIQGDRSRRDWSESWRVTTVDEGEWEQLRAKLRRRYAELVRMIETADLSDELTFGGAVGAVAHAAYHLGAIRQKVAPGTGA